ncbi:Carboxylesterase NlhH [Methylobacterium crusticola]|uniref:Carboxylesterase NlhH n=1 Tax=Methylobacterium crusticola TaxID=1697972 RepID=A0ABQ4QWB1_9HYPH|nr:alpha/beta hydrolase [Methylobacterium crusticola]GJD49472.1 Carboxylesterase NlhH [Methylobacterium crusticola]
MPLDPRARRFLDLIALAGPGPATPEARRAGVRALARFAGPPAALAAVAEHALPGPAGRLPARLYVPHAGPAGPGLLFLHGGGFVAGDLDSHDGLCRALAAEAGVRVLALDYRLAPEHPFPAALEDAAAALAWLAEAGAGLGIEAARLAVGGDSAGAGIAASLCARARDRGGPAIAGQVLLCPVLDAAGEGGSRVAFAEGHGLDQATLARDVAAYAGSRDPRDPAISPLRATAFAGLPPALIHTAACDLVRDDGAAYADRLAAAGVRVRHTCHPGMIHHFYGLGGLIPYAAAALRQVGAELRDLLGG